MASPYDRLIVARVQDVQAATTTEIRRGPLTSSFLAGPQRDYTVPPPYPLFNPNTSTFAQLNDDLLRNITSYLDPIWLFQLELTCSRMARFLRSKHNGFIWYRSLPRAMLGLPEFFQKEVVISQRSPNLPFEFDQLPFHHIVTLQPTIPALHLTGVGRPDRDVMCLPDLDSVTNIPIPMQLIQTLRGTECVWSYLIAAGNSFVLRYHNRSPRLRTLALGGPFQPHFDYRREILGHMLCTARCKLCLKVNVATPGQILPLMIGGLQLCPDCFNELTISYDDIRGIQGLEDLMMDAAQHKYRYSWTPARYLPLQTGVFHWRALVDELSRNQCGLDFNTLQAKQIYFNHIIQTKLASARPIFAARRNVRLDLITIAQNLWRSGNVPGVAPGKIDGIRNAVLPFGMIGDFLFPQHTTTATLYRPQDLGHNWPIDPVDLLRYTRDCNARSRRWKMRKVWSMLADLVNNANAHGGRLGQALEQHHIQRLQRVLESNAILTRAGAPVAPGAPGTPLFLWALKQKVFLEMPPYAMGGARLTTPEGQRVARATLGPLAQATVACKYCAQGPQGLEKVVRHIRLCHPQVFMGSMTWEIL